MRIVVLEDETFGFPNGSLAHIWQPHRRNRSRNSDWSDEQGASGPLAELIWILIGRSVNLKMTSGYRHVV